MSPEASKYFDSPAHRWAYNGAALGLLLLIGACPWPVWHWRGVSYLLVVVITYVLAWSAGVHTGAHESRLAEDPPRDA